GGSDGVLTVIMDPATVVNRALTYELYSTSDLVNPYRFAQSTPTFDGLPLGDYQVRVISARACFDTMDVTIGEPDPLTATATATPFECNVNNDVSMSTITLTGDGGTEPYKYKFENGGFSSSNTFNVFDTGSAQSINYWVRDANGCVVPGTIVIQTLNTFELNLSEDTAIGCTNEGLVTLSVINELVGGDTYSFELLPVGNTNGSVVASSVTAVSA